MSKPRVAIIENSIGVTGALKSITRIAIDLREFYTFQFIVPSNSAGRSWIEGKGFNSITKLPMKEISRRFSSWVLYIPFLVVNGVRLNRYLKRNSIELIHLNDLYNLLPLVIRLFGNRTPYVCHIRFLPDKFPSLLFKFWLKLHLRFASKVIAVSQGVLNQLPVHTKLTLIHNELPVEERYPETRTIEENKQVFTFLYLSNWMRGKGQDFAIEAFSKVYQELPEWKLRFVGGDMGLPKNQKFREELKKRVQHLGIAEKIEWIGFTEDVEREYKQADIILNFSESESFSITCLEALFFGRPVIATDCGGPTEIVDNGQTGMIVSNRNVEAMIAAMKALAKDKTLREDMGNHARYAVREKFSVHNTSFRLKEVYDRALIN